MNSIIVGIERTPNGDLYRVLSYLKKGNQYQYKRTRLTELDLVKNITAGRLQVQNAGVDAKTGRLVATSGSFERFDVANPKARRPYVIIARIEDESGEVLGYRIANYEAEVTTKRISEITTYCNEMKKSDLIPFQNMILKGLSSDHEPILCLYPDAKIETDVFVGNTTNKYVQKKTTETKVPVAKETDLSEEQLAVLNKLKEKVAGKVAIPKALYNKELTPAQLKAYAEGVAGGINVKDFIDPAYSPDAIKYLITWRRLRANIKPLLNPKYSIYQMSEIITGVINGVNINKFANPKIPANEMAEIRIRLEDKLWYKATVTTDAAWFDTLKLSK